MSVDESNRGRNGEKSVLTVGCSQVLQGIERSVMLESWGQEVLRNNPVPNCLRNFTKDVSCCAGARNFNQFRPNEACRCRPRERRIC